MKKILVILTPNGKVDKKTISIMVAMQFAILLFLWMINDNVFLPKPIEIFNAFERLGKLGIVHAIVSSTFTCLEALFLTVIISLMISYLTVVPFFRPLAFIVTKARFLSMAGLSFFFIMLAHEGHTLKLSLFVFGMSVFFVTSMLDVIKEIKREEFNHARTLRMKEWQVVFEVVILSRIDKVFDVVRQNFAIAWMMITMVEGIVRTEGGIGVLLLNEDKYLRLDMVFAIQLSILTIGILLDYLLGVLKIVICPYSNLTLEKK